MASEVDVCNLAMSHIGQDANITAIDPPDGSPEADHCEAFFPIARDAMLAAHSWSFNTQRATLTELATNPQEALWGYAYQLPNLCLTPLKVLFDESTDDTESQPFIIETLESGAQVLYTDVEDAQLVFRWKQTDLVKWSPNAIICLSWLLAHFVAGPITKDLKLKKSCLEAYYAHGGPRLDAAGIDASAQKNHPVQKGTYVPAHLKARQ